MLRFTANSDQYNALSGLAYWIADAHYIREQSDANDPELSHVDATVCSLFDELDRLQVPFWVQNTVVCFAEDWRRYKREYLSCFLESRNITVVS